MTDLRADAVLRSVERFTVIDQPNHQVTVRQAMARGTLCCVACRGHGRLWSGGGFFSDPVRVFYGRDCDECNGHGFTFGATP